MTRAEPADLPPPPWLLQPTPAWHSTRQSCKPRWGQGAQPGDRMLGSGGVWGKSPAYTLRLTGRREQSGAEVLPALALLAASPALGSCGSSLWGKLRSHIQSSENLTFGAFHSRGPCPPSCPPSGAVGGLLADCPPGWGLPLSPRPGSTHHIGLLLGGPGSRGVPNGLPCCCGVAGAWGALV